MTTSTFGNILRGLAETPDVATPQPFRGTRRFRVRRFLGEGGFGAVFDVDDLREGRRCALKVLKGGHDLRASDFKRQAAEHLLASASATEEGMRLLQEVLEELGLPWLNSRQAKLRVGVSLAKLHLLGTSFQRRHPPRSPTRIA